jgi:hypothetical protein
MSTRNIQIYNPLKPMIKSRLVRECAVPNPKEKQKIFPDFK